jgi:hypothetical protein
MNDLFLAALLLVVADILRRYNDIDRLKPV